MNIDKTQLFKAGGAAASVRDFEVSQGIWSFLMTEALDPRSDVVLTYLRGSEPFYDLVRISWEMYDLCVPATLLTSEALVRILRFGVNVENREGSLSGIRISEDEIDYKSIFNKLKPVLPVWVLKETPWSWGKSRDQMVRELEEQLIDTEVIYTDGPVEVIESRELRDLRTRGWRCRDKSLSGATYEMMSGACEAAYPFSVTLDRGDEMVTDESGHVLFGGEAVLVRDHQQTTLYVRTGTSLGKVREWMFPPEDQGD